MSKQTEEAEQCIKKAEKYLKTSLISLKFKPDHDSAAVEYTRAGVCYRNARKFKECADVYEKAAGCHEEAGSFFHAAKCKEQAATACRDGKDLERAKKLMEEAGQQYAESGSPETSAQALEKAASFFMGLDDDIAIKFYEKAYHIVAETDRTKQASEFLDKLAKLYCKQEKIDDAIRVVRAEVGLYIEDKETAKVGRLTCGLVILYLKKGDTVECIKALSDSCRSPGFQTCQDAMNCQGLIDAYNEGDVIKFANILKKPDMRSLDNHILRMTKDLGPPACNIPVTDLSAPEGMDKEEEEMDLC